MVAIEVGKRVKINYRIKFDAHWHGWEGVYIGADDRGWAIVELSHNGRKAKVKVHHDSLTMLE